MRDFIFLPLEINSFGLSVPKGATIAQYTGQVLHQKIRESENFDKKQYREALKDGFMHIDKELSEGEIVLIENALLNRR